LTIFLAQPDVKAINANETVTANMMFRDKRGF
jgi:hypothetical protein